MVLLVLVVLHVLVLHSCEEAGRLMDGVLFTPCYWCYMYYMYYMYM